jgi:hypothetical protein
LLLSPSFWGERGKAKMKEDWFVELIMRFAPDKNNIRASATPEEMTNGASWEAYAISTGSGLIPSPLGWATILPELAAITKIQINLIYRIASYHNKIEKLNKTVLLLIIGKSTGISADKLLLKKVGTRVVVKSIRIQTIRKIAQRIQLRLGMKIGQRGLGRVLSFATAPVFGAFSKSLIKRVGAEADLFFLQDIEIENTG